MIWIAAILLAFMVALWWLSLHPEFGTPPRREYPVERVWRGLGPDPGPIGTEKIYK